MDYLAALEKAFPACWFQEWDHIITSGEGSEIEGIPAFNHAAWESDSKEETYVMGVHIQLVMWADEHGCYWECQDPGTYKLIKM